MYTTIAEQRKSIDDNTKFCFHPMRWYKIVPKIAATEVKPSSIVRALLFNSFLRIISDIIVFP